MPRKARQEWPAEDGAPRNGRRGTSDEESTRIDPKKTKSEDYHS